MSEKAGRQMKTSVLFKRFLPYYSKYKKEMAFDLFCALLTTLCEVIFPQIIKLITNQAVEDFTKITTEWVLKLGGIYLLLRVIDTAANYFMQYWGHVTGTKLETDMRTDLFSHLQQLSFSYYNNTKIGQIMSRITSDLFQVTEFAHHCPEEFFIAGIKIVVSFVVLCGMNLFLTLLVFAVLPFMLMASSYFNGKMRRVMRARNKQVGEINAQVEDSLLGIRVVKSFANEDVDTTAALIGSYEIVPEAVAKAALPYCCIVMIEGEEMQQKLSGYLQVLFDQNPASVGGAMPNEDFYFQR